MKAIATKNYLFFLLLWFVSCANDDIAKPEESTLTCFDGILNGNEVTVDCGGICGGFCPLESVGILNGEVLDNIQLDPAIAYRLTGPYVIRDKASLTIPAGTVIKVEPEIGAYIAVTQGGQLFITGQPDNPVVITSASDNPTPGDWGGLVVCGKAPINGANLGRSDIIDIFYGGSESNDTSGVFNYLRIEYAGAEVNNQKFDAIAFYGVGAVTTVTRIQTHESLGNGIRFIGGAVNTKWVAATNSGDNAIAITNDWSGKGDFWYLSGSANAGIEISSDAENSMLMAIDSLSNLSIIGSSIAGGLNYKNGNGTFDLDNLYTANLSLGINVADGLATSNIDLGNFKIDTIEFDMPDANFLPTNYTGDNPSFYSEASTQGSGNRDLIPDWAIGWTNGID